MKIRLIFFLAKRNTIILFHMYQVFSSLYGHLHFFVHFFFTFMEYFFIVHPISIQSLVCPCLLLDQTRKNQVIQNQQAMGPILFMLLHLFRTEKKNCKRKITFFPCVRRSSHLCQRIPLPISLRPRTCLGFFPSFSHDV